MRREEPLSLADVEEVIEGLKQQVSTALEIFILYVLPSCFSFQPLALRVKLVSCKFEMPVSVTYARKNIWW